MPAKAIGLSAWKIAGILSLLGAGGALMPLAQAQQAQITSPSSTAPAYGGAATEGGPGSLNTATGEPVPPPAKPFASGAAGSAQQSTQGRMQSGISNADRNLMRTIAQIHMAEVDMGKMAQTRSRDVQVRSFAQRMIDDHDNALQALQKLADANGVILPGGPDKKHAAIKEQLTALSGPEFTRRYLMHAGDNAHREAYQLLQQAVQSAQSPEVKAHASNSLALVQQHLQMANHLIAKASQSGPSVQSSGASVNQAPASTSSDRPQGGIPAAPGSVPR